MEMVDMQPYHLARQQKCPCSFTLRHQYRQKLPATVSPNSNWLVWEEDRTRTQHFFELKVSSYSCQELVI